MHPDTAADTEADPDAAPSANDGVGAHRRADSGRVSPALIALLAAGCVVCIVLISLAYREAKTSSGSTHFAVFWLGMLALVTVAVIAGLRLPATGWAPTLMLLVFGLITYLPKVLMSPSHPIYFDEYAHLRHAQDVMSTGNLGVANDLLPVIQYYPGLSVATLGVHYGTGLGLWHAGLVVIGLAHCASLLLVFALARAAGLPARWTFFAAVVFAANPGFMYFDSQYGYESLAIPFLLGAALCTLRARTAATSAAAWRFTAGGAALAAATIFTHHVSSAIMAGLCVLIAVFVPRRDSDAGGSPGRPLRDARLLGPWITAAFALAGSGVWNLAVSPRTRSYVLPSLTHGIHQLFDQVTGSSTSKGKSTSTPGQGAGATTVSGHTPFSGSGVPRYEQLLAYTVPILVGVGMLYSAWTIWRSADRRLQLWRTAPFSIFTLAYLASLPLALTTSGNQVAHRSWPFLFTGVCIFGIWGFARWATPRLAQSGVGLRWVIVPGMVVALMCLNIGGVTSGANTAYRFPGPYAFGRDNRFDTAELDSVVKWAGDHLSPSAGRVITDRFTAQPLIVGTRLQVPTNQESFANSLFRNPQNPSAALRAYLRSHGFRYFILDRHILRQLPVQPFYQGYSARRGLNLEALGNIRNTSFIHQVYGSKNYRIYTINP